MVVDKLKKLGLKLTPQRLAIVSLLQGNTRHPSAEEIYNELKPQYPSLSLATVYNTVEVLVRSGELREIMIAADRRHFDPNVTPHGHFLCRSCKSLQDLDARPLEIETLFDLKGYLAEDYALYIYGICQKCLEGE
ncbi:MAG TPA: transcriptional repressor [Spirochaetia bacterium]|nr:transcriptional repressor [Spirochaetia bacterium]